MIQAHTGGKCVLEIDLKVSKDTLQPCLFEKSEFKKIEKKSDDW